MLASGLGLIQGFITSDQQTFFLLTLSSVAFCLAALELGHFGWVRGDRSARHSENVRKGLSPPQIDRRHSVMAYATFLFSLIVPPSALIALPAGIARIKDDLASSDALTRIFLAQLIVVAGVIVLFLLRRIVIIWRKPIDGSPGS